MIKNVIQFVLNLLDQESEVIDRNIITKDEKVYYSDGNINIIITQNVNYRLYVDGYADEQVTTTTIEFSNASLKGNLILKNEIPFTCAIEGKKYSIINNINNYYAEIMSDDRKLVLNSEEFTVHYEDSSKWLMINKAGNGMKDILLGTYFIKKLPDGNKLFLNVNINPEKIIFDKHHAQDIFEQHPTDCIFQVDPNMVDFTGIIKTHETIEKYFPAYYDELNEILHSFDGELIPKLLSFVSPLYDEEFNALYGIQRMKDYQNQKKSINKSYKLRKK